MTAAEAKKQKWNRIYTDSGSAEPQACGILEAHLRLLEPAGGSALDLACGRGGNALLLARVGFKVTALDISDVVIDQLQRRARLEKLPLDAQVADLEAPARLSAVAGPFNVVTVSDYLSRDLCRFIPSVMAAGGLLFYETFVREKTQPSAGPSNPGYLLKSNELLDLFGSLRVLVFSDLSQIGDWNFGLRNKSALIAVKPAGNAATGEE